MDIIFPFDRTAKATVRVPRRDGEQGRIILGGFRGG
jgi:hypothetical protein